MTRLIVNGRAYEIEIRPHEKLSDVLRKQLASTACECPVARASAGPVPFIMDGKPVTACLVLGMQAEGREITTIEGLGTVDDLHPIQEAYIEEQGFQCGFCTPGLILMTKVFFGGESGPG